MMSRYGYVPLINTPSTTCLTALNWEEAGVTMLSYALDLILIKPGIAVLKKCSSLADLMGWSGAIVLDARMLLIKDGILNLRSPYDGSTVTINTVELIDILSHLNPNYIILPEGPTQPHHEWWTNLPQTVVPLFSTKNAEHLSHSPTGGLYGYDEDEGTQENSTPLDVPFALMTKGYPLASHYDLEKKFLFTLSDAPLNEGYQGLVYTQQGRLDLTQQAYASQFDVLDQDCSCTVCKQGFSRAYLHHLLIHTPLLCHRYLIQHNAHFIQQCIL